MQEKDDRHARDRPLEECNDQISVNTKTTTVKGGYLDQKVESVSIKGGYSPVAISEANGHSGAFGFIPLTLTSPL